MKLSERIRKTSITNFRLNIEPIADEVAQLEAEIVVAWDSDRAARVFNVEYSGRAQKAEAENEALRREKKNLKEALEAYAIGGGHEWAGLRDENAVLKREIGQWEDGMRKALLAVEKQE